MSLPRTVFDGAAATVTTLRRSLTRTRDEGLFDLEPSGGVSVLSGALAPGLERCKQGHSAFAQPP